jgi:glycosyltransferase involved in cell wall biosynthesis
MVFPSKYEGWGLPVTEALRIGVPIACSRLSILMEQAGDASLFFDPDNPQELADTLYRLWTDEELRKKLSLKGQKNSARFSWEKTARIFRAHYRLLSEQSLKKEDQLLVQEHLQ